MIYNNCRGAGMADKHAQSDVTVRIQPVMSVAIDDVALASLRRQRPQRTLCSVCDDDINGEPASTGLLMWTRGDETLFDEPPLCEACATTLNVTAFARWAGDDEQG